MVAVAENDRPLQDVSESKATSAASPIRVLRLVLSIGETSAPYNQFTLAQYRKQDITICTYFRSKITPPEGIALYQGDGTLRGFCRAVRAAIDDQSHDVVHAHTPHVGVLFLLATLFRRKRRVPPIVYTVHNCFHTYRKLRIRLMLMLVFSCFQKVVCCSRASFESVPGLYKWLAGKRLRYVQNGVNLDRIDGVLRQDTRHGQAEPFTVVVVGRLIEMKDPMCLVDAFHQPDDRTRRLVFIGDGNLRDELLHRVETLRMTNQVELAGLISRDEVYQNLANADLLVSASRGEGLPIAILEAMACRCPVVLSDIAPHREIADQVDFIPLIPPGDVKGFAREIRRFEQMPVPQRARIGELCRQHVESHFSLATMHQEYESVYRQVITSRGDGQVAG